MSTSAPAAVLKTFGTTLSDGKRTQLRCGAAMRKDGRYNAFVTLIERDEAGKVKESKRGASATLANFAEAQEYVSAAVKKAISEGWTKRRGGGGFVAKPDAFGLENLPKPAPRAATANSANSATSAAPAQKAPAKR